MKVFVLANRHDLRQGPQIVHQLQLLAAPFYFESKEAAEKFRDEHSGQIEYLGIERAAVFELTGK